MSLLMTIQQDVDRVAQAIAAVLDLEVNVYTADLQVVAATGGGPHTARGERVRGFVINHVLATGQPLINETPGFHQVCTPCSLFGMCPEKADISFPIRHDGTLVGVMSITAFTDEQHNHLLTNSKKLLNFLGKMADLIASKLTAHSLLERSVRLADTLDIIVQGMDDGVLAVDAEGKIVQLNRTAEVNLGLRATDSLGHACSRLLPALPLDQVMATRQGFKDRELVFQVGGRRVHMLVKAAPLISGAAVVGAIATFQDIREVRRFYNSLGAPREHTFDQILGSSPAISASKEQARRVAVSNATVLITGESGTGKELFARAIHAASRRCDGPFRAINCAAIPETLLESELFGYVDGAFTGASRKGKPGKLELASGGTFFLDEVAELPLHLQAKLLRVLEEQSVERLGGTEALPIDVRILAATNQHLEEKVARREFRGDLYYRLNVIPLRLPALRERKGDFSLLLVHSLDYYAHLIGRPIEGFSPEAKERLERYHWPGNVRELRNVVQYCVHMATGPRVELHDLPQHLAGAIGYRGVLPIGTSAVPCSFDDQFPDDEPIPSFEQMEAHLVRQALKRFGTSGEGKKRTAECLGINLSTLYRKIEKYQVRTLDS